MEQIHANLVYLQSNVIQFILKKMNLSTWQSFNYDKKLNDGEMDNTALYFVQIWQEIKIVFTSMIG